MRARRDAAVRMFKIMLVASIAIPVAIFSYAAWVTYKAAFAHADEQLSSTLDIMSEQAGKIFQSVDLGFAGINTLIGGMSDDEIKASEQVVHAKLKELDDAVSAVDGIWVFGQDAHPLVTSRIYPAPRELDISDREYFQAQLKEDAGLFVSPLVTAKVTGLPIITVSRRSSSGEGRPFRVLVIAVKPGVFTEFYGRLARGSAASFSLVKKTGDILARFPAPPGGITRFGPDSGFIHSVTQQPEGGIVTTPSVDQFERRIGYRKLGYHDIYVSDGIPMNALYVDWLQTISSHLIFGAPATAFLFILVLMTMRRTDAFYRKPSAANSPSRRSRQSQKMEAVGQLTGGVAHDFNNLLTIIIGNLGIAKRGVVEARAERALDNALTGAERAAQLTQRLLAFSRRQPLNPRAIDSNKLIVTMADLLTRTLGENIELETIGGAGLWNVEADVSELEA